MKNYRVTWTFDVEAADEGEALLAVRGVVEAADAKPTDIRFVYNQSETVKLMEEKN